MANPLSAEELKPLSEDEIQGIVSDALEQAEDFIDGDIDPRRQTAQLYYDGAVDLEAEEGRSQVVITKCRDTARLLKAQCLRPFLQTDKYVEFVPRGPEDVRLAEQATALVGYYANQNNFSSLLDSVVHDAIVKGAGFLQHYWEDYEKPVSTEYTGLTDGELGMLNGDVTESVAYEEEIEGVPTTLYDVTVVNRISRKKLCIEVIPPEEIIIDNMARSFDDAMVAGRRREVTVGEAIAMGVPEEDALQYAGRDEDNDYDEDIRRKYAVDEQETSDPASKPILVTEAWFRIDADGDGLVELRKFLCVGFQYHIVEDEPADEIPLTRIVAEHEPHVFFPTSIVEMMMQDQDAQTSLMRAILDNAHLVNQPRTVINDQMVNLEDAMNPEIGAIIRARNPDMIRELATPFVAGQTLPALQYLDQIAEARTGITRAAAGLDPDALQSTTKAGVQATVQAAQTMVEMVTRNIANGVKDLFQAILRTTIRNQDKEVALRMRNEWVRVNPKWWHAELDVSVNVGLGNGQIDEKAAVLQLILTKQEQIMGALGPDNEIAGFEQIRNTMRELAGLAGIHNIEQFFATPAPKQPGEQQQGQPQQPDPNQIILQAEQIKAQQRAQEAQMKTQQRAASDAAKIALDREEMIRKDDRERDEAWMDTYIRAAEIQGQHGAQVNMAAIKGEVDRDRERIKAQASQMPPIPPSLDRRRPQ